MLYFTAFSIGLLGSLHCVGMCGPIAMALPYQRRIRWSAFGQALLYNSGRTLTYVLLGATFGLLGKGIFLAGYQSALSIGLGVLLLVLAFFAANLESRLIHLPFLQKPLLSLKTSLARLLRADTDPAFFRIGMLNGLLPCGLVYMAVVGAVATGSIGKGALYMAAFGLGTFPLMLSISMAGNWLGYRMRQRLKALLPVLLVAMAALLIFRGLNFDLPRGLYIWEDAQEVPLCH